MVLGSWNKKQCCYPSVAEFSGRKKYDARHPTPLVVHYFDTVGYVTVVGGAVLFIHEGSLQNA